MYLIMDLKKVKLFCLLLINLMLNLNLNMNID